MGIVEGDKWLFGDLGISRATTSAQHQIEELYSVDGVRNLQKTKHGLIKLASSSYFLSAAPNVKDATKYVTSSSRVSTIGCYARNENWGVSLHCLVWIGWRSLELQLRRREQKEGEKWEEKGKGQQRTFFSAEWKRIQG